MSTVGQRVVKYMAECMDWHETDTDQEQNQIARHMAQFAERERRRTRIALMRAVGFIRINALDAAVACIVESTKGKRGTHVVRTRKASKGGTTP